MFGAFGLAIISRGGNGEGMKFFFCGGNFLLSPLIYDLLAIRGVRILSLFLFSEKSILDALGVFALSIECGISIGDY